MLNPSRGNATGNDDGLGATCEPAAKRGWERRYHHVIFVVDRDGKMVQSWPQHDKLFEMHRAAAGPHKIKMSPYDPEKHVWVVRRSAARDLQVHLRRQAGDDARHQGPARARRRQAVRPADRHRLAARRHVLHQRRLRRHARRQVRQGRQVPHGLGHGAEGPEQARARTSGTPSTASRSARTGGCSSSIAATAGCRCSTRTASSSTCGPRACARRRYAHLITTDQFLWVADGGTMRILKYDLNGQYLYGWGGPGGQPGAVQRPALAHRRPGRQPLPRPKCFGGRVQKFRPKPGADPAKVIGPEHHYSGTGTR